VFEDLAWEAPTWEMFNISKINRWFRNPCSVKIVAGAARGIPLRFRNDLQEKASE
jgi:hypothetical protein